MTGPFAFLDKPTETPSPFDFLNKPKDDGVFAYLGNLSHNFGLAVAAQGYNSNDPVISPMANIMFRNNPEERLQIQAMQEQLKKANLQGSDTWKVLKDKLQPSNMYASFKQSVGDFIDNPSSVGQSIGSMVGSLPKSLASIPGSFLEAGTGLNLGDDIATAMTPEERAQKTKDAAAVMVTGAVTATARFAMLKGLESLATAGTTGASATATANIIKQGGKLGVLGNKIVRAATVGSVEGAIGGGTFGAVSGAGDENQVGKIIGGMMFAPLGAVAEMIGSKIHGEDNVSKIQSKAADLFNARQLMYSPDKSLFELQKGMEGILTSDDMAMAVAKGKLSAGAGHIIVPGVSELTSLDTKAEEVGGGYYRSFSHKRPDGLYDVLLTDDARLEEKDKIGFNAYRTFQQTGYVANEVVSHGGKDYLFSDYNMSRNPYSPESTAALRDPVSGKIVYAPWDQITRNSQFDLDNGQVLINSPVTLKGKLLAVNRGATALEHKNGFSEVMVRNPYADENTSALNSVKTGQPIAFIGMRQSRGQQIIGNGKFYALTPEHLLNYTPSTYTGYSPEIIKTLKTEGGGPFILGGKETAPGRQTIPGILDNHLSVNRLTFNNPFVFDGKHYSFSRDVENFYNKYHKGGSSEIDTGPNAVSQMGVNWNKIFTPKEMAGIAEARNIEQKPVGVDTNTYFKNRKATADFNAGRISAEEFNNITQNSTFTPEAGKTHSESHYAIIDRIVAGAMKRNGYDGFIYRSGGIHNSEVVDVLERGVWNRKDQTVPVVGKASNILDQSKFVDKLYDEFKNDKWLQPADQELLHNTGEIKTAPASFEDAFNDFTKNKGFLPEELPSLRRSFEQRIHNEIVDNLPDEEKVLFNRLKNEIDLNENTKIQTGVEALKRAAVRNNMYFDEADAGVIHLRDATSNKSLGSFHSAKDAQDFITKSGQEKGINLDGNANVPPSSVGTIGGGIPDNLGPLQPPATNVGWLDRKQALTFSRLQWMSAAPSVFKNWDTLFGTTLHANVFDKIESAYRRFEGSLTQPMEFLRQAKQIALKANLSQAQIEQIGHYNETVSIPEFLATGEYGRKPLTPFDIAAAKQLQPADLTAVMNYQHALRDVDPKDIKAINQLKIDNNISAAEERAIQTLDAISKQPKEVTTIYSAVKYARLLQNPELALSKADYAKKFNLNQAQLQTAKMLDQHYKSEADIAGIPEEGRLANYMTHARLYEKGNVGNAIHQLAASEKEKQFYAAMVRTGELSAYEKDPFAAGLRYTMALRRTIHLNPAIADGIKELKKQVIGTPNLFGTDPNKPATIPPGAGDKIMRDAAQWINDVQGRRAIGDNYANTAVDFLHNKLGLLPDANIRQSWVNTINKVITASAQAGRPFVGIRNFYQNNSMYFTKWGLNETIKMLSNGAKADLDNLKQAGFIQGYSPIGLGSPVDDAASLLQTTKNKLRTTLDKSTDIGMKLSGQQAVNERAAAGAFLTTRSNVAEMARNLVNKKFGDDLTKPEVYEKAYHTLQLERYSDPVRVQFDKLIKNNQFDQAANFLGNSNVQETWGTYGNANAPMGWNNNLGRLVGKFGSWSVNHRDYVVSLASRGTKTQRLQALGRLALTEGTVAAAAATFGVNLSSFYSLSSLYFNGGPTTGLISTAMNALFGHGSEQGNAIRKVQQLLPYDFDKDEFHRSIVVPFSYGVGDLVNALEMASNGDVAGGLAQIGGIKEQSQSYKPSEWEQQIGDVVGGK